MSTTIPIQELDISTRPPGNRTIHAIVTLLWPYSSSTRQCALLLSERDFRLRARGGQIRVKFSGPAARAVAEVRLGIGDEVVLELGNGEWVTDEGGVPVRVPGKSVGELQFGRGVSLTVMKNGVEDAMVSVAEDAVDEVEEEEPPQAKATPRQSANFRASFGGSPGSAAIYSSPAYMRKAAKYSYLDGISRLFEDDWGNQDLPRKKARTSIGDVKSWKMVDRTPSPERPSPEALGQEDQEMLEADSVKDRGDDMVDPTAAESVATQVPPVATIPSKEQEPIARASVEMVDQPTTEPSSLARPDVKDQDVTLQPASSLTSTLPQLQFPSASPASQSSPAVAPTIDPVTPRLVPLSSTALPSTTPQISPLATKNAFGSQVDDGLAEGGHGTFQVAEMPESRAEVEKVVTSAASKPITKDSVEQGRPAVTGNKSTAAAIASIATTETVTLEESESAGASGPFKSDDLKEEDAFSDDEADEVLSAYEKDEEMMYEDDAEDVFDADGLEGEEPSDDETTEDPDMHPSPDDDKRMEEAAVEETFDVDQQAPAQSEVQNGVTAQQTESTPEREAYKQPGFTPASTLLRGEHTPATKANPSIAAGQPAITTPFKKPSFGVGGIVPSTEFATPAARKSETPNRTPQSVRDKVMKRTFSSLFGIKGTPSPEKEDAIMVRDQSNGEENSERQLEQSVKNSGASEVDVSSNQGNRHMGLDGQSDLEEMHSFNNARPVSSTDDQASLPHDHITPEAREMPPIAANDTPEQQEDDELPDASPRGQRTVEIPPAELINLDSDSGEESKVGEVVLEQASESHELSPPMFMSTTDEHGDVEASDTSVQEDLVDDTAPEPILVDVEEASNEHDITKQQQPQQPEEEPLEDQALAPNNHDQDVKPIQPSKEPDSVIEGLDSAVPDTMDRTTVSPEATLSPEPEAQGSSPVEPVQTMQPVPEQSQAFGSVADITGSAHEPERQINGHEALLKVPDSVQPSLPQQEQELRSASATPKNVSIAHDDSQIKLAVVDDVEMLDAQERGRESPDSQVVQDSVDAQQQETALSLMSFESQAVQDKTDAPQQELEPSFASFESQVVQDSIGAQPQGAEPTRLLFESQVVQDSTGAPHPERESPLASFGSHVVQETTDAQESDAHEQSSRPASRDTVEDFSPVQLGSFSERMSGIVSEAQAMDRQDEPELSDHLMSDQKKPEESGLPATTLPVDAVGPLAQRDVTTPTRATKHSTTVEVQSSPSSFGEFSPVKINHSTHEQVLTPRATLPGKKEDEEDEDDSMADETLIEQQLASELHEDSVGTDTRPLENQTSEEGMEQYRSLDVANELSSGQNEESIRRYELTREMPTYLTSPITPSATQLQPPAVEPEARLSHASMGQVDAHPISERDSDLQHSIELSTTRTSKATPTMSEPQQNVQEQSEMPPPEQPAPPKTPGRKSLRSRLSNVPDVISAWFSPKRSSIAAQDAAKPTEVETAAAITADVVQDGSARKEHAGGIATAHTYFTKLASLEKRLNPTGDQTGAVDILAIVVDSTKDPIRAKGGPRDYYTVFKVMDPSIPTSSPVRVEVFRPWKAVLPAADVGDVVLLRGFVVKSRKRQPYLLSTDSSAWCVWRFAEHNDNEGRVAENEADKSVRARRMSHIEVREEVKGPPVEYGSAEKDEAKKLRDWWIETHDDSQGGAAEEAAGMEETDANES